MNYIIIAENYRKKYNKHKFRLNKFSFQSTYGFVPMKCQLFEYIS